MRLANVGDEMINTGESCTSSISRAKAYFEDAGTDSEQLIFFWYNIVRYGRVDVMEWAHRQGYARVWDAQFHGSNVGEPIVGESCRVWTTCWFAVVATKWLQLEQRDVFSCS